MSVGSSAGVAVSRQGGLSAVGRATAGARSTRQSRLHCAARIMDDKYNHPALYSNDDAFWDRSYWDRRYQQDPTTFEWYRDYKSLQPVITQHLSKEQHILQIGVGTSRLQVDMADDGYNNITNTDYSPVAIQRLQQMYPDYNSKLQYAVADARNMSQYNDCSFGGVLDKGALDALLCGDGAEADAAAVVEEVYRLLKPGAAYVMITSASPRSRLQYLQQPTTPWSQVLVYEVGQQGARNGPYQCMNSSSLESSSSDSSSSGSYGDNRHINSRLDQPGEDVSGNKSSVETQQQAESQLQAALKLPSMGHSHLVYVCYKPLQT